MPLNLPAPYAQGETSLVECLERRRRIREYSNASLPVSAVSRLLWSAQGMSGPEGKRTAPSAGGRYPLRLHVLVRRVEGVAPGVYDYDPAGHALRRLGELPAASDVEAVGIGDQPWLGEAALVMGVAADLADAVQHFASQPPEGERGRRYVFLEAGAVAQNVHLQATDLALGCVLVGGFDDERAREMLGLPPGLEPTALLCIGHPRRR